MFPSSFCVLCDVWNSLCLENREWELANICGRRETIRLVCFDWTNGFNNGKLEIILVYRLVNERFFRQQLHLLSFHLLVSSRRVNTKTILQIQLPSKLLINSFIYYDYVDFCCYSLLYFPFSLVNFRPIAADYASIVSHNFWTGKPAMSIFGSSIDAIYRYSCWLSLFDFRFPSISSVSLQ